MLKNYLENELKLEAAELEKLRAKLAALQETVLGNARGFFYFYTKNADGKPGKRRYIKRGDVNTLRLVSGARYLKEKVKALSHNISVMEQAIRRMRDCDDQAILEALPRTYASAIKYVREVSSGEVFQSENPVDREGLVVTTSTGVKVRTKGELVLYEILIEMLSGTGIAVYYEKKLELIVREPRPDGTVMESKKDVYPDFTIVFPDDTEIYWELCGMFDRLFYRSRQYDKFCNYYDNGIYMPKNLIVTMEAADKPLDLQAVRRIIESQILARL